MKSCVPQKTSRSLKPGVVTVSLMGILIAGMHLVGATTLQAEASPPIPTRQGQQPIMRRPAQTRLPAPVKTAVLRTHARDFNVRINKLRVVSFSQESWSDSCLGLGRPEESCGLVMVPGWRVEVGNGAERWFYRTDRTGSSLRMEEPEQSGSLPQAIGQKVLAIASKDSGIPVNQLTIGAARPQVWDGCLGVADFNQPCTRIGISGWQVIVTGPQQYWVYHLDQEATQIKRNPTTSGRGTIVPSFWQLDADATSANTGGIVFQSMTSGGFAGLAYKTLLMENGQVMKVDLRGQPSTAPTLIRRLTPQQVQEFVRVLQQNEFTDFSGFNYSPTGGADYFTIALATPRGAQGTQYADMIQDQTPPKLQRIIQAWNRITTPDRR